MMGILSWFGNTLRCPRCASKDVEISSGGTSYSGLKGGLGAGLFGSKGALFGVGGKKNPDTCHCRKCGYVWHQKL